MLKYEFIFEFILILRIFRHFNIINIIKIVTHLEVVLQNVKRPKSDRNSGNVRNSSDYGTFLRRVHQCAIILAHRCPPPPIGNADQTRCANNI